MRPTHHFLRGRRAALATPGAAPLSGEIDFAFMSLVTALPQEQQAIPPCATEPHEIP